MATIKFKEASPFVKENTVPPVEDFIFNRFEQNCRAQTKLHSKIGVALFGAGRAGTIHLQTIARHPQIKLFYVVEDLVQKHEQIKQYWGLDDTVFLTSGEAQRVYNDSRVEAVIVSSPTFTHEKIVTDALKANKAVFCEKPIAQNIEAVARCYQQAKKNNKPLFCAFNRRFDPAFSNIRERVHKGEVGHVRIIKSTSKDSPIPSLNYLRNSGGVFHDSIVHDIDMICWVLGEFPIKVNTIATANSDDFVKINDYDTVVINFLFSSGTIGIIDLSRECNFGYDQRLEVFGPKGLIRADNQQPLHSVTRLSDTTCIQGSPICYSFSSRYYNSYQNEMEHFLKVVRGEEKCKINGFEIIAVSKIATAAEKSARTGQSVNLTWSDDDLNSFNLQD